MNSRIFAMLLVLLVASSVSALELSVSPDTLTLPSGETDTVTLTLTNDGSEPINVTSITRLDGSDVLTSSPSLPIAIDASASSNVDITVEPVSFGTFNVQFEAEDNTSATAATSVSVTVPEETGFSAGTDLRIGDDNQERDETVSGTITLRNDRNGPLTSITVSDTIPDRYELVLTNVPSSLDAFETATVTYEVFIPLNQDSGASDIGDVTFTGSEASDSISVSLEAESGLRFEDIDVEGESDSDSNLDDGDEIDFEFIPGERVLLTIEIENTLNYDMEDVEIEMFIDDIDDGDEIDEESDREDIRDGDTEVFEIEFDIPTDADEDTYEVVLTVTGDDDEGAFHETQITLDLVVERERDDLEVSTFDANPSSVCPGDSIRFDVEVRNVGSRDQDDARVVVEMDAFDLADARDFSVEQAGDRDDEYDTTFTLRIPNDAAPGTYDARAIAYYDRDRPLDASLLDVVVRDCGTDSGSGSGETDGNDNAGSDGGVVIIEPETPTPEPTDDEGDADRTNVYVWLLVGLNVLVVVLILVFVVRLLTR